MYFSNCCLAMGYLHKKRYYVVYAITVRFENRTSQKWKDSVETSQYLSKEI